MPRSINAFNTVTLMQHWHCYNNSSLIIIVLTHIMPRCCDKYDDDDVDDGAPFIWIFWDLKIGRSCMRLKKYNGIICHTEKDVTWFWGWRKTNKSFNLFSDTIIDCNWFSLHSDLDIFLGRLSQKRDMNAATRCVQYMFRLREIQPAVVGFR